MVIIANIQCGRESPQEDIYSEISYSFPRYPFYLANRVISEQSATFLQIS